MHQSTWDALPLGDISYSEHDIKLCNAMNFNNLEDIISLLDNCILKLCFIKSHFIAVNLYFSIMLSGSRFT